VQVRFRQGFYDCLYARGDALFELADALLCSTGPVKTLVELCLAVEHRRGHGGMYAALNEGDLEPERLRWTPAAMSAPQARGGRITLAADVSNRLCPDAATSADRLFCHTYGRGRSKDQFIPGRPSVLRRGARARADILDGAAGCDPADRER
jgi:hypothetical protein